MQDKELWIGAIGNLNSHIQPHPTSGKMMIKPSIKPPSSEEEEFEEESITDEDEGWGYME